MNLSTRLVKLLGAISFMQVCESKYSISKIVRSFNISCRWLFLCFTLIVCYSLEIRFYSRIVIHFSYYPGYYHSSDRIYMHWNLLFIGWFSGIEPISESILGKRISEHQQPLPCKAFSEILPRYIVVCGTTWKHSNNAQHLTMLVCSCDK